MPKFLRRILGRDVPQPTASDAARILGSQRVTLRQKMQARTNMLCDELGRRRVF